MCSCKHTETSTMCTIVLSNTLGSHTQLQHEMSNLKSTINFLYSTAMK
jgi:hypothetical protein